MEEKEKRFYLAYWNGKRGAERGSASYQRRDDGSHIFHNTEEYWEWWYFDASFMNGYHIVITYHYRSFFLTPMIPCSQLFIYKPDGTKIERLQTVSPEEAHANPDYCHVEMGEDWVKDKGDFYELHMKIEGVGAHLIFKNIVPQWKLGTGYNYKDEDSGLISGWVVPMPHADVDGELFIQDETIKVKGTGYHDHNWGNYHSYKTFSGWYWGRIHHDEYALDYGWVLPREKDAPIVSPLMIARKSEIVLSTDMVEVDLRNMKKEEKFGQDYAGELLIRANVLGVTLLLLIRTHRIVESVCLTDVADWELYYYRFIADYNMEIEIDGVKDQVQGELLHELMLL